MALSSSEGPTKSRHLLKEAVVEMSFFVPCLNEARKITSALDMIQSMMKDRHASYEILVIDDGSTDGTSEVVQAYCRAHPEVPIIARRNSVNRGLGFNYVYRAKQARGRYYMLINGDNDIPQEDLGAVIDLRGRADIIVPYVVNQRERPFLRSILSMLFTFLVNLFGGHWLRYYNGPVLHRRENVIRYQPKRSDFSYQAELLCRSLNHGCTYLEVPFRSMQRKHDKSSALRISNLALVVSSLGRIFIESIGYRFKRIGSHWIMRNEPGGDAQRKTD